MTVQFRCKDFLLKECESEVKGTHSADEMMKLVDFHVAEEHPILKVSSETWEKIRRSMRVKLERLVTTVRGRVQIRNA
jgi:predicted small metal-binding protein